jgi:hypothetical protein
MTRNLEEERTADVLQAKKAESLWKRREYGKGLRSVEGKGRQKCLKTSPKTG